MDYVYVYLKDEVPLFGCGWQSLLVLTDDEDARQVRLLKWTTCEGAMIPRDLLTRLVHERGAGGKELDAEAMRGYLLKNARDYKAHNADVRTALIALGMSAEDLPAEFGRAAAPVGAAYVPGAPVDATEAPLPGEGSGKFIQRLWMAGVNDPERLVALVLTAWPGRKTKVSDVFYNYNLLKKADVPNVPPWPSKKKGA